MSEHLNYLAAQFTTERPSNRTPPTLTLLTEANIFRSNVDDDAFLHGLHDTTFSIGVKLFFASTSDSADGGHTAGNECSKAS